MKRFTQFAFVAASALALASACSKDDGYTGPGYEAGEPVFAIVAQVYSSSTENTTAVLLTNETLESGQITTISNGTEVETLGSEWSFSSSNDYMYSIKDSGSTDPVQVGQYYVDAAEGRMKLNNSYVGDAYHIWGMWGDNTFATVRHSGSDTSRSVEVETIGGGDNGRDNQTATYYGSMATTAYYTVDNPVSQSSSYETNNYLGKYNTKYSNGETAAIVGFVTSGDYVYASYATTGVSLYEINQTNSSFDDTTYGDYVMDGYGSYYNETLESTTYLTPLSGVPAPLTPGNAYIARYPVNGSFESTPTIFGTDKMGQAFGRTTGNPLNTVINNDDDGYVYVFSPGTTRRYRNDAADGGDDNDEVTKYKGYDSYVSNIYTYDENDKQTDKLKLVTTDHGAKVMRIKSGSASFDSSFGTDGVQDLSSIMGNYTFSRVWHITGSKFLLRVIHRENLYNVSHKSDLGDGHFYIYDSSSNTATKVTGLPDPDPAGDGDGDDSNSSDSAFYGMGNTAIGAPCFVGDKAYIPMAIASEEYPSIWVVNSSTASATKGLQVVATRVSAVALMNAQ
ncbi:MAG: DUF4374 domain-containing protein [Rikenellaceae bacterium]